MVIKSMAPGLAKAFSTKVGMLFSKIPLSPNAWTLLALLPAAAGFYFLLQQRMEYALPLFIAAGFIDAVDGAVARVRGIATNFGAYLDGIIDRFVEAFMLFGLMLFGYADWILPGWAWLSALLFFGTTMTTFSLVYADHKKVVTDQAVISKLGGVLERAERLLLMYFSMALWFVDPLYATYAIAATVILSVITVLQRIIGVSKLRTRD